MACSGDPENQSDPLEEIQKLMSSVTFIGYNINAGHEEFFQTNLLLGDTRDMNDVKTVFTGETLTIIVVLGSRVAFFN